jgi:23S rRNA (cytosine1962-C5)-methyltransferase
MSEFANFSDPLQSLPWPSQRRISISLVPKGERAIKRGHPWVFAASVKRQSHQGVAGDMAVVYDSRDRFLAVGLYDPEGPIRVRVLASGQPTTIDAAWFRERLSRALELRSGLEQEDTDGYRLVHGENDGFPGLVIDRYAGVYVAKVYSAAWFPWLQMVDEALSQVCSPDNVVLRLARTVQQGETWGLEDGCALHRGEIETPVLFRENGLFFGADPFKGHKTGFFLDQRDNRLKVEGLSKGRDVLNVFSYSGGFSLYAARGGASSVTSIDSSGPALRAAEDNFALNPQFSACRHQTCRGDAFALMGEMAKEGKRFGVVVVDPPAFAKRAVEVPQALKAYTRLARLALKLLAPGGDLVMASCSSRVGADEFFDTVMQAATQQDRPLQVVDKTYHAVDHPITFSDGAYLKCLYARDQLG